MNIDELRLAQVEFEKIRKDLQQGFKEINSLRQKFVRDFSEEKIRALSLDDYVIGKGNDNSFCYRIEIELNAWGNIHGSNARKFGIYYGKFGDDTNSKYRIGKAMLGEDINEAFELLKKSIIDLTRKNINIDTIKKSPISPMFKGKILSIYNPDKYLNIFSSTHLDYFINKLGIDHGSREEIEKQNILLHFKNDDNVMKNWSNYEFNKFLYYTFGSPNDELKTEKLPPELRPFNTKDFPPIEKTNADFIELNTSEEKTSHSTKSTHNSKVDYESNSKINKQIGDRGEQIVLRMEKLLLKNINRQDLVDKVFHVAAVNDRAGYDIQSFDLDGNQKFIEVKATLGKVGKNKIYISHNEYEVAKSKDNYYFYIVFEVGSKKPKIWRIKALDFLEDPNIELEPVQYQIKINSNQLA